MWSPVSGSPDQRAFRSTLWGSGIVPGVAGPRLFFSRQPTNVWTDPLSECRWTLTRGSPEGRCLSGLHSHVYLGRPVCDCEETQLGQQCECVPPTALAPALWL